MNDRQLLKVRISELSNEDLFKMVSEEIVNYPAEEINLAYEEMESRGILPNAVDEAPRPAVSLAGCWIGCALDILEIFIIHSERFTHPRAAAGASFVYLIAAYWDSPKLNTAFWKWVLWAASIVLLGSLALWDIPNLLQRLMPLMLAFGVPTLIYSAALYWMSKPYRPARKSKFTTWLIGCLIFTLLYSWLMTSGVI